EQFITPLRRALRCVTNAPVDHGARRYVAGGEVALVVNRAQPVPLPPTSLFLKIGVRFPHLHLYAAEHPKAPRLARWHVPTARIALEDVLGLILRDLKAKPRESRWWAVLRETKGESLQGRSGTSSP